MDTHFAPPERTSAKELAIELDLVSKSPVMSGLLHSVSGLLAILDEQRQIVALNDSFMQLLGIDSPAGALGMRPGEALECIHAHDESAGCGTTKYCSTCGAAIAIVSSLGQDQPAERICALSARRSDKVQDIALLVKAHPIRIQGKRFLLLFIQDVSKEEHRTALERTFFHDINNMVGIMVGATELLLVEYSPDLTRTLHEAALRLHKEIAIQRCLSLSETCDYQPLMQATTTGQIMGELKLFFANHPAAGHKTLKFYDDPRDITLKTDRSLLSRVLCNMIINALEASDKNTIVRVWLEPEATQQCFCVWNAAEIPQETARRIFQRNFSTKEQAGRGIGTYSMKLLGEEILGGKVNFTTSREEGTTFRFAHPL